MSVCVYGGLGFLDRVLNQNLQFFCYTDILRAVRTSRLWGLNLGKLVREMSKLNITIQGGVFVS